MLYQSVGVGVLCGLSKQVVGSDMAAVAAVLSTLAAVGSPLAALCLNGDMGADMADLSHYICRTLHMMQSQVSHWWWRGVH